MQKIMIRETQSFIDRREEDFVDKNNRRESIGKSGSSRTTPGRHGRECPPVRAGPRWFASVPS
jgi:hypothetical protein